MIHMMSRASSRQYTRERTGHIGVSKMLMLSLSVIIIHPPRRRKKYTPEMPSVERTALVCNRVLYKKLLRDRDRDNVISELNSRGIVITDEMYRDFRKMVKALRENEKDVESFKPNTDIKLFEWW